MQINLTQNSKRRIPLALAAIAVIFGLLPGISCSLAYGKETKSAPQQLEFFEKKVRPLLVQHCYECHSNASKKLQAGLFVDSRQGLIKGGESGTAVVPGDPESSSFMEAVRYESYEMPPKGKLSDEDISIFEQWIEMGAPWPQEDAPTARADQPTFDLQDRKHNHWVWQPIQMPTRPPVKNATWPKADLDYFILADLEANALEPTSDADRLATFRRLYMDLVGLPPSAEQIETFVHDQSDEALERVVDQLLDSPHYGERWGRHWLDLVRFAESRGHEFDNDTPNAYQYRDYIIRALNTDVPYDQLVREHIAGDLLAQPRLHPSQKFNESVLGTGFWFLGEWVHSPVDIRKDEADRFDNMIDVMSKTFLGVTVACARCHDHKFDAISTADYYSLSGFLQSSDYRQVRFESIEKNRNIAHELAVLDNRYQRQLLDILDAESIHLPRQSSHILNEAIIVDYGNLPQRDFIQDGFSFGSKPLQAGFSYLSGDQGIVDVASHGAAANDPFWFGLKSITQGTVRNNNSLNKLPKSGRTLRTPTFELKHGSVTCLVKGSGHVVACVDSHRLIAGPLHGQTIKEIKSGDRWVKLNLDRYVGHRLHLEFIPSNNEQLSVRLVTQGLDAEGLNEIDRQLVTLDQQYDVYAKAADTLLNGNVDYQEQVFADFESGTYDDWSVEGEAFGDIPFTAETIAKYQGEMNHRGKYFVNSHNIRSGGDVGHGDGLTGTLTSPKFEIDFQAIEFLVGGGSHQAKTCVNLIVDGKVVLSATGKDNNRMSLRRWDVRPFAGKEARIQVVDNKKGGWGNIGVDHIVFLKGSQAVGTSVSARRVIEEWQDERNRLRSQVVLESHVAPAMLDGSGEDDKVLIRGNSSKTGNVEPRHFLTAVTGNAPMSIPSGSGRLKLAEEINNPANPLTSRVIVNRIWHHLMGRGIVPTTDDFGVLGQRPTHPELLDHLATKFMAEGRSIKSMIKYIALSRSYQMSTNVNSVAAEADPKNLLWHHRPPKRLGGEVIRDSLLAISGKLDTTQFGPPVPIYLTSFMDGRGRPPKSGPLDGDGRRSIYISVRRNFLSPFMLAFDTPIPFSTMGRRNVSNVPAQALILMNDPFVVHQAKGWADRAINHSDEFTQRVRWMYLTGFSREPTEAELDIARVFVGEQSGAERWADFAHVLINTKEFIYLK